MKHTQWTWPVVILATAGTIAIAQSSNSSTQSESRTQSQTNTQTGDDHYRGSHMHGMHNGMHICLGHELLGANVATPQDEVVGKLDDVVIHPGGQVAYAVVSAGGILGMGEKLLAVPWSAVSCEDFGAAQDQGQGPNNNRTDIGDKRDRSREKVTLAISKDRLKSAPGFDKDHWPDMANTDWAKSFDTYYSQDLQNQNRASDRRHWTSGSSNMSSGAIMKLSDIMNENVESPDNNKLGDIKDVAIDTSGRVNYVVLAYGGALGVGEKKVAVPWESLQFTRDSDKGKMHATLSTSKDRLDQAPRIRSGKDNEEEMRDPAWIGRVYEFYSVQPYWSSTDDVNGTHRHSSDEYNDRNRSNDTNQPPKK